MKKFVTFSNFMVLLGIMTILFYLIPAITITPNGETVNTSVNLFGATFGCSFTIAVKALPTQSFEACGGLISAFFLGIVGIVLTFLKSKNRLATLLAFPFYTAAGVLVCCAANLTYQHLSNPFYFHTSLAGGAITVATFWLILAFFALVDFILTIAKPKQPVNPAY